MIGLKRWRPWWISLTLAGSLCQLVPGIHAAAQDSPPAAVGQPHSTLRLPLLARCDADAPTLPRSWQAVGIMAPFKDGQLHVGEFVSDGNVPAMRATIYGLEQGTADLLITDGDTYQLLGPHDAPSACLPLGRMYAPPADRWLSSAARCVGNGNIGTVPVEWWEMPASPDASPNMVRDAADASTKPPATWLWYKRDTRLPWRMIFTTPAREPAVIGQFAQTYFSRFEPLAGTNLAALRDFCRARTQPGSYSASASITDMVAARHGEATEAERRQRLAQLVPGLSVRACVSAKPMNWPQTFALSAMITPTASGIGPTSAAVFYDFEESKALLTQLYDPHDPMSRDAIASLLQNDEGHDIRMQASPRELVCRPGYPGVVRPDWMAHDQCRCRGVAADANAFGAGEQVQVLSCPTDPDSVFWAIYTSTGRPVSFRATALNTHGLMLADYDDFKIGQKVPSASLQRPAICGAAGGMQLTPQQQAAMRRHHAENCAGCHMVSQP